MCKNPAITFAGDYDVKKTLNFYWGHVAESDLAVIRKVKLSVRETGGAFIYNMLCAINTGPVQHRRSKHPDVT